MNISSINAYNNATFTAKKQAKKTAGKFSNNKTSAISKPGKHVDKKAERKKAFIEGASALAILGVLSGGAYMIKNSDDNVVIEETVPTVAYAEIPEVVVEETEAPKIDLNEYYESMAIPVKPRNEWVTVPDYEIVAGDSLTKIVIGYAGLSSDTQYKDLIPYIERLKLENPALIIRVIRYEHDGQTLALPEYTLLIPDNKNTKLNVNSILSVNRLDINASVPVVDEDEPIETEPVATEPIQPTSPEDTIIIGDLIFEFEKGTLKKQFFSDYQGIMHNQFTTLDKKTNGDIILTKYEGRDKESGISSVAKYENGIIVEMTKYKEGKPQSSAFYEYDENATTETIVDKTAKGKQIDVVTSVYDKNEDLVHSRVFSANKKPVVTFDFINGHAQIGETSWGFVEFICNDDAIGSEKYVGITEEGNEIRFDILENGFNVEYVTAGEIFARDQFDLAGNLIFSE